MKIGLGPGDGGSPLRGRYLVQNPRAVAFLKALDTFLAAIIRLIPSHPPTQLADRGQSKRAQRVLLMNGAHLGDVLLSTAVIPLVQRAFPGCTIGFVVGSWASCVLDKDDRIRHVHIVDHWKLNRSARTRPAKMLRYLRTRSLALLNVKALHYDIAIDLYFYFPNNITLAWQAGIPRRIGYTSGGCGPLLTEAHDWQFANKSVADYQCDLIGLDRGEIDAPEPHTTLDGPDEPYPALHEQAGRYVVLHIGTGSEIKQWPLDRWRELAESLIARGYFLVFTGAGAAETRQAALVAAGLPSSSNLANALGWTQFIQVIKFAALLIGVDSVAGHVAANFSVPSVTVATGIAPPRLWHPLSRSATVLSGDVSCSPCNRSNGCASMTCISIVEVKDVLSASLEYLARSHSLDFGVSR